LRHLAGILDSIALRPMLDNPKYIYSSHIELNL
jgi:hypothetical protein